MAHPQPPAISTIDRVPDEVLLEILLLVAAVDPGHDDNSFPTYGPHPLLPVVQVNKRFNAVASPLLVRDWHLRPADESGAKFVLHLLKHPQLRCQVQSLAVDERPFSNRISKARAQQGDGYYAPQAPDDSWPQSLRSTAELEQLVNSAKETCPTLGSWFENPSWLDQIRQRCPHAIAALALAWVTGLQELDFMVGFSFLPGASSNLQIGSWMIRLVKTAVGVLSPPGVEGRGLPLADVFTKLHCVSLLNYGPVGYMPAYDAAAFFRLPNLRVFNGQILRVEGLALDETDPSGSRTSLQLPKEYLFPDGSSSVEELYLYRCYVTENGLSVLTRSCRRLRVLALMWEWNDHFANSRLSNDSIASAMGLHSASLEKILIEGSEELDDDGNRVNDGFDPGSLGDCLLFCDKLETLSINLESLYGREYHDNNSSRQPLTEVLPPGLTHLGLSILPAVAGGQVTKELLLGLIHQCGPEGRFFKLQNISLIGSSDGFMVDEEMIALAKKNRVELTKHDGPKGMM